MSVPRRLAPIALAAAAALLALPAAPAAAATIQTTSSNWAGYAAVRHGTHFRRVSGSWVQPAMSCSGARSYSSYWVGLGGYHESGALEQIGTAADCDSVGTAHYTAWYELVPAAAVTLKLKVHAGDTLAASVAVSGHSVRLSLANRTTGAAVTRTLRTARVDTTSAEWIAEAPSQCDDRGFCETLALGDFGTASFSAARATTTGGHTGAIADRAWTAVAISLDGSDGGDGGDQRFARDLRTDAASAGALSSAGDAFSITYAASPGAPAPAA